MNRDIDILTTMRLQGMPAVDIEYVRRAFLERNASPAATPAPVAQKVPDAMTVPTGSLDHMLQTFANGWNACRNAMLAAAQSQEGKP